VFISIGDFLACVYSPDINHHVHLFIYVLSVWVVVLFFGLFVFLLYFIFFFRILTQCTVNGHKYSSPLILRYIFHMKPHFSKKFIVKSYKRILIIFGPEEAEIFKDYFFILA